MNHIYHSIWNEALGAWIAVSEIATGQGKRSANRRKKPMTASPLNNWQSSSPLLATGLLLCSSASWALPTGNELVAGQATVTTPTAGQMQINQASQNAIINWQGFSIDQNQAVNIQQPNAQAALLNRVVGQDASQIQGQLNANGQVYLVNPNGILFSKTAQVDVGGLIASTHNISNADFMNGNHHFTQNGATGSIDNQGNIKTPEGGIVALIGKQVTNSGTIETPKGTTALAAGKTVDLDFQGNGLIEVKVTEAALNAQITNQGAIKADGGHVILSANAAGQLIDTVINSQGVIQARGLTEKNGVIKLDGGNTGTVEIGGIIDTSNVGWGEARTPTTGGDITVTGAKINLQNSAKLNASGNTGGGNITIGDKQTTNQTTIQQGATVTANTLDSGTAGTINVLANMNNGKVQVDGQLNAAAPKNGDGGFIDTSAAHVNVADTAKISTKAANGKTGKWLIDPTNYTIAASGGDTTGANLATYLGTSNIEIKTLATGSTGQGDIFVNDTVSWNNYNELILTAHRDVNINAPINANGGGSVRLRADSLGTGIGTVAFKGTGHITVNNGAAVGIYYNPVSYTDAATKSDSSGNPYSSKLTLNTGSYTTAFMLVNNVNKLQAINTNLSGNYALGIDIDASATKNWNSGAGFTPIGTISTPFTGKLNGLTHYINGLTINRPSTDYVGLFGVTSNAAISNVNLELTPYINGKFLPSGSITGQNFVGSLIGFSQLGKVDNVYGGSISSGVIGLNSVGGLIGATSGTTISNARTEFWLDTRGNNNVGGLVGKADSGFKISNSRACCNIKGTNNVGGLVGYADNGSITNSYMYGASVTGTDKVGGLLGYNPSASTSLAGVYSISKVIGSTNTGGLVGSTDNVVAVPVSTAAGNYWDTQASGQTTSAQGTGLTTAQMTKQANFKNWDFTNTWTTAREVTTYTKDSNGKWVGTKTTQQDAGTPIFIKAPVFSATTLEPIVVATSSNSTPITPPSTTPAQTTVSIQTPTSTQSTTTSTTQEIPVVQTIVQQTANNVATIVTEEQKTPVLLSGTNTSFIPSYNYNPITGESTKNAVDGNINAFYNGNLENRFNYVNPSNPNYMVIQPDENANFIDISLDFLTSTPTSAVLQEVALLDTSLNNTAKGFAYAKSIADADKQLEKLRKTLTAAGLDSSEIDSIKAAIRSEAGIKGGLTRGLNSQLGKVNSLLKKVGKVVGLAATVIDGADMVYKIYKGKLDISDVEKYSQSLIPATMTILGKTAGAGALALVSLTGTLAELAADAKMSDSLKVISKSALNTLDIEMANLHRGYDLGKAGKISRAEYQERVQSMMKNKHEVVNQFTDLVLKHTTGVVGFGDSITGVLTGNVFKQREVMGTLNDVSMELAKVSMDDYMLLFDNGRMSYEKGQQLNEIIVATQPNGE